MDIIDPYLKKIITKHKSAKLGDVFYRALCHSRYTMSDIFKFTNLLLDSFENPIEDDIIDNIYIFLGVVFEEKLVEELKKHNLTCKELMYIFYIVYFMIFDVNNSCNVISIDGLIIEYRDNVEKISNLLIEEKEYLSKDEYDVIFNNELIDLCKRCIESYR